MPKERCIRRCAVYGRMWLPGEIREIEQFEPDGEPVVTDHFRLIGDGENYDPSKLRSDDERREKARELAERDKTAAVLKALESLDPDDDRHWTQGGLPSMQVLHLRTDLDLARAEVSAIAPAFDREQHRAALQLEREGREQTA